MSEYPKKLVSDEGGVAMVNEAKDEATLKARGYKEVGKSGVVAPPPNPRKPKPAPKK